MKIRSKSLYTVGFALCIATSVTLIRWRVPAERSDRGVSGQTGQPMVASEGAIDGASAGRVKIEGRARNSAPITAGVEQAHAGGGPISPKKALESEAFLDGRSGRELQVVKGEVLVRFRPGLTQAEVRRTTEGLGASVVGHQDRLGFYRLRVPAGTSVARFIERHSENRGLEVLEPNFVATTLTVSREASAQPLAVTAAATGVGNRDPGRLVPNDPLYPSQWALPRIHADVAWAVTTGSPDVAIAVLDTGVDSTHPDLRNQVIAGYDFVNEDADASDDNGHGTHVAGIIAAEGNNGLGIAGVAWGCRVMPVKVMDAYGEGAYSDIVAGIVYAAEHGARVLNLSVGSYGHSRLLADAVEYAASKGTVVVAAAGNDASEDPIYPAALPQVHAVSGTDPAGAVWPASNRGSHIRLTAPGVNVRSTGLGHGYVEASGTSASAALVSGAAALVLSADAHISLPELDRLLCATADDLGDAANDVRLGRLNLGETLRSEVRGGSLPDLGMFSDSTVREDARHPPNAKRSGAASLPVADTSLARTLYKNENGPVHGWIVLQAWKKLPDDSALKSEMREYLPREESSPFYGQDFRAPEAWKQNLDAVSERGTALIEGAWEEDATGIAQFRSGNHFWSPNDGFDAGLYAQGRPGGPFIDFNSALQEAQAGLSNAVRSYVPGSSDNATAYYYLGRTAHVLADMSSPAHVHMDMHAGVLVGWDDNYEDWTGKDGNYRRITSFSAGTALPELLTLSPYPLGDLPPSYDALAAALFYSLASYTDAFDSDDRNGHSFEFGYGKYRCARNLLRSGVGVVKVEYWNTTAGGTLGSLRREMKPGLDYAIESNHCGDAVYYYRSFYDDINNTDRAVVVYYEQGAADVFTLLDETADVFDAVVECVYQPRLQARAIGYTAALFQLFWERTHSTISGRATHRDTGAGVENVTITFSGGAGSTTTGRGGLYSHEVARGWAGTATPSRSTGSFAPALRNYEAVMVDQVAQDYIWAPPIGTRSIAVQSFTPGSGVVVTMSPSDNSGLADGTTPFTRIYNENASVTLTAPPTAQGNSFRKWMRNGIDFSYSRSVAVTSASDQTLTAVYSTPPPCCGPANLTVNGTAGSPVGIPLSPAVLGWDANGYGVFYVYFDEGDVWPTTEVYQGIATSLDAHNEVPLKYGQVYSWRVEGKDRGGNVVSSAKATFTTVSAPDIKPGDIVITEFKVAARTSDDLMNSQYIELYNNTDHDIRLSGLQLAREDWGGSFLAGTIRAGAHYVVAGSTDVASHHIAAGPDEVWDQDRFFISWDGCGQANLKLVAGSSLVDQVNFKGGANGFPCAEDGHAYELINPCLPNENGANWRVAVGSANLIYASNRREYGSPGRQNTVFIPCDEGKPIVTIDSPTTEPLLRQTVPSVSVAGAVADPEGNLARVVYRFNDGAETAVAVAGGRWCLPLLVLREGDNSIFVEASDTSGNQGVDGLVVTYYVDRQAPLVEIRHPTTADTVTVYGPSILLGGSASDDSGISGVEWRVGHGATGAAVGAFDWTAGPIPLQKGPNEVTISAKDPSNNVGVDVLVVVYTNLPPAAAVIGTQPQSMVVAAGAPATFSVGAGGTEPLAYQWYKNSVLIAGATNPTLVLPSVGEVDAGDYAVTVANALGSVTSHVARLTVRPDLDDGLLAYYPLDVDTLDASGHGRHGTPSSVPQWVTGPVGQALRFNAGYVTIPSLPDDIGSFSLSLWAFVEGWKKGGDADPRAGQGLIWFGDASTGWVGIYAYGSYDAAKTNEVYVGASPGEFRHTFLKTDWFNRWHHLCLTHDAQLRRSRFYLEGILWDEGGTEVSIAATTAALGRHWWAGGTQSAHRMVGAMDEVRIYNRALEADEVRYLAGTTFIDDYRFAAGRVELRVAGPDGQEVEIQASEDLVGWWAVGRMTLGSGGNWSGDSQPSASRRFYRATVVR